MNGHSPGTIGRLLRRHWPSSRLGIDPLSDVMIDGRYTPISVANFKLIAPVARRLLERRRLVPLTFQRGKRLAIIIPFRDRELHLRQMLPELVRHLQLQDIVFRILVIEQEIGLPFNRGALINVGFKEAADSEYCCIHDVDAVPVAANYLCPSQPLRLVTRLSSTERGVQQHSAYYFSGAVSLLREQAYAVNGFSNGYWGWGKEDDDFLFRLLMGGFVCYADTAGDFHDLPNPREQQVGRSEAGKALYPKANRQRKSLLLRGLADSTQDGLSTIEYEVMERRTDDVMERITVRLSPGAA